ncbi:MAG: SH3 domain-containing protein [Chloroflexota bacterium]|mgnify:CR=1 FL=1
MADDTKLGWSRRVVRRWLRAPSRLAAVGLVVAAILAIAQSPLVGAQGETPSVGTVVKVANTDGEPLNLRAGASASQLVVARLPVGEELTVIGPPQTEGTTRWIPVRTSSGVMGWVAAPYLALVSTPTALPSPSPELALALTETPPPTDTPTPMVVPLAQATSDPSKPRPVDVEVKMKYPEVRGRDQEITVWVTRDGQPIAGAVVTVVSKSGEDDEPLRELDPTDDEGKTRRAFDIRKEKGAVELDIEAVAPDGGQGKTTASYFRR